MWVMVRLQLMNRCTVSYTKVMSSVVSQATSSSCSRCGEVDCLIHGNSTAVTKVNIRRFTATAKCRRIGLLHSPLICVSSSKSLSIIVCVRKFEPVEHANKLAKSSTNTGSCCRATNGTNEAKLRS
mmetsp:Transcript_11661/g.16686  ORF Transcript_11661/g.16686 Transcript_11661/m.16686 type:complete len:126 (+) Transcript_11661:265-642(+)